jgi:hypothetical protein
LHHTVGCALEQFAHTHLLWSDAIQRADPPHQDEVQTFERTRALDSGLIGRRFNNAQLSLISRYIRAGGAQRVLRKSVTSLAMPHTRHGLLEGLRCDVHRMTVVLQ